MGKRKSKVTAPVPAPVEERVAPAIVDTVLSDTSSTASSDEKIILDDKVSGADEKVQEKVEPKRNRFDRDVHGEEQEEEAKHAFIDMSLIELKAEDLCVPSHSTPRSPLTLDLLAITAVYWRVHS